MDPLDFSYDSVAHYEQKHYLTGPDLDPDVIVSTVYNAGPLNEEFQSVTYEFEEQVTGLERFRETVDLQMEGEKVCPVVTEFKGYSSMTLLLPTEDHVEAVEFAEEVLKQLDSFYIEQAERII